MRTNQTVVVALIAILWVVVTTMGSTGYWFPGLLLAVPLIALHAILGVAHEGRASWRLVTWVILPWALTWIVAFVAAQRFAADRLEGAPPFTILGMHPSFAWIVILYWLVASLITCAGFILLADDWLDEDRWKTFRTRIAELNANRGGAR